jgi:hypothetical protein
LAPALANHQAVDVPGTTWPSVVYELVVVFGSPLFLIGLIVALRVPREQIADLVKAVVDRVGVKGSKPPEDLLPPELPPGDGVDKEVIDDRPHLPRAWPAGHRPCPMGRQGAARRPRPAR